MSDSKEAPKLIIDSDWKAQAQAEKDRLAAADKAKEQARAEQAAKLRPPGAEGELPEGPEGELPPADFFELLRMLVSQSLLYLGAMPDPETGRRLVSLEMAQYHIDLLGVLEAKTKGNLDEKEKTYLARVLHELRLQFVEVAKAVAKAIEQGKISPSGGMGAGGPGGITTPGAMGSGVSFVGPGGTLGGGGVGGVPPINLKGTK